LFETTQKRDNPDLNRARDSRNAEPEVKTPNVVEELKGKIRISVGGDSTGRGVADKPISSPTTSISKPSVEA